MTKFDRIGGIVCLVITVLALAWLCLIAIPQFVDRVSRHETTWADSGGRHVQDMASEKVSEGE